MATSARGVTNTRSGSCVEVRLDCAEMWSLAQQFAYGRLSVPTSADKAALLADVDARARRIAATYARFYLETEEAGSPDKKGRYYWMALGAFASKTVACSLESLRVQALPHVQSGLARGNFWLFMDIAPWHWYWSKSPGSFWMCEPSRRADACAAPVRKVIEVLPWAQASLPKIAQMQTNEHVHKAFELVGEIEAMNASDKQRPRLQLRHLLEMAAHEQGKVLQPLIYDDDSFTFWVRAQRSPLVSWAAPGLELVFAAACTTDDPALKSVAPADIKLEQYKSRMKWISSAAKQFHHLMQAQTDRMERELNAIAGWVEKNDTVPWWEDPLK
jgi:hypothetical protein